LVNHAGYGDYRSSEEARSQEIHVGQFRERAFFVGDCFLADLKLNNDQECSQGDEWNLYEEKPVGNQRLFQQKWIVSPTYHLHPIVSLSHPPTGPPRLRPRVIAMLT
jgi:hypothetical protein